MKKFIYIILGATTILACSKETDFSQADKNGISKDGTYTVTVYLDDVTKASININGSKGVFTWDGSEQIAIWDRTNSKFVTFDISDFSNEGNKQAKFTTDAAEAGAVFDNSVAYYPASIATVSGSNPTYTFPTGFDSLDDASKGFPMEGTLSGGNIHFHHLGCLIDLTLNNVPSFTRKLILNAGTNDITVTASPTDGKINAVVPIPAGEYVLTVKLEDDNHNTFFSKARSSKTYTARNYYPTNAITLGRLLTFTNEAGWVSPKVHIWQKDNGSNNNTDFTTTEEANSHKLYQRNSNVYYFILDSSVESWTVEGENIGVQFYSNVSNKTTQTDCVALYRNIDFTIPEIGGMKTPYRIYVYMRDSQWVEWKKKGTEVVKFTTWGGISTPYTNCIMERNADDNGYIFYHEFPVSDYGKEAVKYRFYNEKDGGWESKDENEGVTINCDIWATAL